MTRLLGLFVLFAGFACAQNRVYELRTYTCNEGKLEALKARFRDHNKRIHSRDDTLETSGNNAAHALLPRAGRRVGTGRVSDHGLPRRG